MDKNPYAHTWSARLIRSSLVAIRPVCNAGFKVVFTKTHIYVMDGQKISSPAIATQSPNYGKSSSVNQTTTSKISKRRPPSIAQIMSTNSKNRLTVSPIRTKPLAGPYHPLGAKPSTPDTSPLGRASRTTSSANICQNHYPPPTEVFAPPKPLP
jgi:hypothetical protein